MKGYFKYLYRSARDSARFWWGLVSAEAYALYIMGNMEVGYLILEGGLSIGGMTVAVLVVEGVVIYVVAEEVLEKYGLDEEALKDKALFWEIYYTENNLIDEKAYERHKWKEYERLNQKVQYIDGLIEEVTSMPGYDAMMSLENPNYQ